MAEVRWACLRRLRRRTTDRDGGGHRDWGRQQLQLVAVDGIAEADRGGAREGERLVARSLPT